MTWLTSYTRRPGLTPAAMARLRRRLNRFCRVWERLALEGACDDLGGAECQRVLSRWLEDGAHHALDSYIRLNANLPAPALGPEEQPRLEVEP